MSRRLIGLIIALVFTTVAFGQSPNFDYPYFVTGEGGYIVADNVYTIPCVGDWDDDNDNDLLVGVFFNGNIHFYENISSGSEPEFADFELVYADGNPISVTYG